MSMAMLCASLFDVSSDVYTITYYFSSGKRETALWVMAFSLLSLITQLIAVYVNHHKNTKKMLIEMVGTLSFLKLGINYWRYLTDAQQHGHELMSAVTEVSERSER